MRQIDRRIDAAILEAIAALAAERPWCPTVREVAQRAEVPATTVHDALRRLRAEGMVDWESNASRTLRAVG